MFKEAEYIIVFI